MADERGLYGKYRVERVDGKHVGRCFVLELDDRKTWSALLTWAESVEAEGNATLAADVRKAVLAREHVDDVLKNVTDGEGWQR